VKRVFILSIVLLLSACSSNVESGENTIIQANDENDYCIVLPFKASDIRQYHGTYLGTS
jgi:protein involved in sex pheromone biosynthesis